MSDSGEIKLKDTIYNEEIYDSDEEEDEEEESNYEFLEDRDYESCDEETENVAEILQDLLKEVATVDAVGKKVFRVEFTYTKNLTFVDKNEDCDFDKDDEKYPIMPDGGEEFFIPYMVKVAKNNKKFKGCVIETNVKNFSFVL